MMDYNRLTMTKVDPKSLEEYQKFREESWEEEKRFSLLQGSVLMAVCLVILIPAVLLGMYLVNLF